MEVQMMGSFISVSNDENASYVTLGSAELNTSHGPLLW